jgi:hypothetical protein
MFVLITGLLKIPAVLNVKIPSLANAVSIQKVIAKGF